MKNEYSITKDQLKELAKGNAKVEKWFPEAFEAKLEVGKWYNITGRLFCITKFKDTGAAMGYGVDDGEWFYEKDEESSRVACNSGALKNSRPATESDVFEALKKEAVKRYGEDWETVKLKAHIDNGEKSDNRPIYRVEYTSNHKLWNKNGVIFHNGKWAEIIKEITLSKSEAEAKLNELINDGYDYKIG